MYAIVRTGGKQYRVEEGQNLLVERLAVAEGADVALEPILYRSEETVFDKDGLQTVKVTAKVIAHERGEKLRVFKFKPKRGYKRRTGHRQDLTRIEVTEIALGRAKAAKASAKATAAAEPSEAPAATAASAKAAADKPSAKPAADKPSAKAAAYKPSAKPAAQKASPKAVAEQAGDEPTASPKEESTDGA